MTGGPTAEVHARKVLSILKERNVGVGGGRMLREIEEAFIESGGRLSDCVDGVECGVEKGVARPFRCATQADGGRGKRNEVRRCKLLRRAIRSQPHTGSRPKEERRSGPAF